LTAVEALADLGEHARDARGELLGRLNDLESPVRARAAAVLLRLGPEQAAVEALADMLLTPGELGKTERRIACWTLESLGPAARPLVPALLACLERSRTGEETWRVLCRLAELPGQDGCLPRAVRRALGHAGASIRQAAARVVGGWQPAGAAE